MKPNPPEADGVRSSGLASPAASGDARLEAVGSLAAGLAHEFNNILTVMIGTAELLARDPATPDEHKRKVERIIRQGQRGSALIRQIMDFSQRTESRDTLKVDLGPLVAGFVEGRLASASMGIEFQPSGEPLPVRVDPARIEIAFGNILMNAVEASPADVSIVVSLQRVERQLGPIGPRPYARLRVVDAGAGIDPAVLPRVFEPFFGTKANRSASGLGLTQAYGLVRSCGGEIVVRSSPGEGTRVDVFLPILASDAADEAPSDDARGRAVVLVVEDDEAVRTVLCWQLDGLGYDVIVAADGREAVRLFDDAAGQVDLLITDWNMPEMNGGELCETLRRRAPGLEAVILSGYAPPEAAAGAPTNVTWLQKPLALDQLDALLTKKLGGA